MTSKALIDEFVSQKSLALAGVSRNGRGFGNSVRKELGRLGYRLYLVHPEAESIDGEPCAKSLTEVASQVGGALLVTPPSATLALVREAAEAKIPRVWMQQGAESPEAVRFCEEHGIAVVHGECIMMFAGAKGFPHSFHRWLRGALGRMPR